MIGIMRRDKGYTENVGDEGTTIRAMIFDNISQRHGLQQHSHGVLWG